MRNLPILTLLVALAVLAATTTAQERRPRRGGFGRMPRMSPFMQALDTDSDGTLSASERNSATASLLTLDRNGDGNITSDEIRPERGGVPERRRRPGDGPPRGPGGGPPGGMSRMDPLMRALDLDADDELFDDEVADAGKSLATLDTDGDGVLSADELRPDFGRMGGRRGRPGGRPRGEQRTGRMLEPTEVAFADGTATIPDQATFSKLSYQGQEVLIDTQLAGLEFVKFTILGAGTDDEKIYFINTETHRAHMMFGSAVGLPSRGRGGRDGTSMFGVLVYRPMQRTASGEAGLFTFEFEPEDAYAFDEIAIANRLLTEFAPIVAGRLEYHPLPAAMAQFASDREKYDQSGLPYFLASERYGDLAFLPLNPAVGFGRLRMMKSDERPGPRDVVVFATLPNEMPRVAGVITAERQTPLSHVNLRAIQDRVPNAFIAGAADSESINALDGKYVRLEVRTDGYDLREASGDEVATHFAALRPKTAQIPPRDLTVREIRPLDALDFSSSASFGAKSANLGELRRLGLPEGVVPDGFAIPFSFYDEFMKHNRLYAKAEEMQAAAAFRGDAEFREKALAKFRKQIRKAEMPSAINAAIAEVQREFPIDTRIRCRSSTNNEDLPGFSGAGLYGSYTHRPDEGHLAKSVKQVYASLWTFRAFEEREFHRIDHAHAAMGVLLHPSFVDERANGVAVTDDIVYQTREQVGPRFYVNTQVGEDLVTNPDARSTPEELLLAPRNPKHDRVMQRSNRADGGEPVLSLAERTTLRRSLRAIERRFRALYAPADGQPFAMEIEFKVGADGQFVIKQARPWVY